MLKGFLDSVKGIKLVRNCRDFTQFSLFPPALDVSRALQSGRDEKQRSETPMAERRVESDLTAVSIVREKYGDV